MHTDASQKTVKHRLPNEHLIIVLKQEITCNLKRKYPYIHV